MPKFCVQNGIIPLLMKVKHVNSQVARHECRKTVLKDGSKASRDNRVPQWDIEQATGLRHQGKI